jgi:hypothetical protein
MRLTMIHAPPAFCNLGRVYKHGTRKTSIGGIRIQKELEQ